MISDVVNSYDNKVIIGETLYETPLEDYYKYYGKDGNLIQIPGFFKFLLLPWNRDPILNVIKDYYHLLPSYGWPNFQFGNHDTSRTATRLRGRENARLAAVLLLTLKGTPFIYNGEELGMIDVSIPIEKVQDPTAKLEPKLSRDPYRTPMQWNLSKNAGFTNGNPWLPVSDDYKENNVKTELQKKDSFLILYKKLISLRNSHKSLQLGNIKFFNEKNTNLICYNRIGESKEEFGILINFSDKNQKVTLPKQFKILLNTFLDEKTTITDSTITLRKNEAVVISYNTN